MMENACQLQLREISRTIEELVSEEHITSPPGLRLSFSKASWIKSIFAQKSSKTTTIVQRVLLKRGTFDTGNGKLGNPMKFL